jgi:hypothetical protein
MVCRFRLHIVGTANKLKTEPCVLNCNTAVKGIEACHLLENRDLLIWKLFNQFFFYILLDSSIGAICLDSLHQNLSNLFCT